ncbi:MAG: serine/threonine-protein kinase, partial [Eubacteriales bacterium]|nr:serine/threonine-protein kinase [Eubacteriales bacterium]
MKTCYNCFHELPDTARVCSNCGLAADISNAVHYPHALPCGSVLAGRYLVGRVLGQGGFGVTYVAQEYQSKKLVAIKEYYPDAMAIREASSSVVPYNQERAANFEYGKERFLEEAKTLAEFIGNPNIVRVSSYFEENGTAYFVMEYVNGISLKKYLTGKGGRISWEEALRILTPVMDALSAVHGKGITHRDVTPDNIVIMRDGNVKLLDFGSARYSIG